MKVTPRAPALVEWREHASGDCLRGQTAPLLVRAVAPDDVFGLGQRGHFIHPSSQRCNAARICSTQSIHDAIDLFCKAGNRFLSTPQRTSKIAAASGASSNACVASALANIC